MVIIRRAEIGDIAAMRSVLAATWRDTYSSFLSEAAIEKVTAEWHAPKVLERELKRPSTFSGVAEGGSHGVVGMVTAHLREDLLLIARLYMLPAFQRQGIGKQLIEASHRAFPQARRVGLKLKNKTRKVAVSIAAG